MPLICQKIWYKKEYSYERTVHHWAQSLIITIPKKGNLRTCNDYNTISLITHLSNIMLRIILNLLNQIAENILAKEKAGFRKKRITIEQILNLRIMAEKHIEHGRKL